MLDQRFRERMLGNKVRDLGQYLSVAAAAELSGDAVQSGRQPLAGQASPGPVSPAPA
jgi:hypothetical protein